MEGHKWDGYVAYFYSLKNFFVHKNKDLQTLQYLSTSLQVLKSENLPLDRIKPGDLVAAKIDEDNLWYRAKILNKQENACNVQLIDYGNSMLSSNIKQLPEKLAFYHPMAHHCMLKDIDDEEQKINNNNELYDIILDFITSIEVVLIFLSKSVPYEVEIVWDDINFKTFLNNIFLCGITFETYKTLKTFDQIGAKKKVKISHVTSINEFYVETEDSEEIKSKIEYELENRTVWDPVIEFNIGKMVIAKSETDNRWYRVRILDKIEEGNYACYFIDYGIREKCSEFYEAVGYLNSAPPFIKRCSLHIPFMKKELFDGLSKSFIDEVNDSKDREIIMTIIKNGEPCVVDLDIDNLSMTKILEPRPVNIFNVQHINSFTAQLNTKRRRGIIRDLEEIITLPPVKNPKIDKIYGANLNKKWFRVKLKNKKRKDLMEVIVIDFGGRIATVKELFALSEHMSNAQYVTLECLLGLDSSDFCTNKFRKLCHEGRTEFSMIVLKRDDITGYYVQLFLNNEDIINRIRKD